jgi:hypothetical protein
LALSLVGLIIFGEIMAFVFGDAEEYFASLA